MGHTDCKLELGSVWSHPNRAFWSPPQATGDYMGVFLRNQKVHWVYRLGKAGPTTLSINENIGEQFAAVSIDR